MNEHDGAELLALLQNGSKRSAEISSLPMTVVIITPLSPSSRI